MTSQTIKIGTRGSKLALYQAEAVKKELENLDSTLKIELKIISTKGDEILDVALSKIGDKGLFTKELENAMLSGEVDMAVHSLKDLQTELPHPFCLASVLPRANFKDAIASTKGLKLADLTPQHRIATSSIRRKAGLLRINKDFNIVDIRGNVNTRLRKMEEGYCDAIIMAAAGLQRLGLDNYITEILEPEQMIPAVSQGVIAIETLATNTAINELVKRINHQQTWQTILAERAFMRTLQGGCQVPVGCYSKTNNQELTLIGFVASKDGERYLKEQATGSLQNPEQVGVELAKKIIGLGGDVVVNEWRQNSVE